jgi:hypothetical protein
MDPHPGLRLKSHFAALGIAALGGSLLPVAGLVAAAAAVSPPDARMSLTTALVLVAVLWLASAAVVAPVIAVVLSALWPVTRRGSVAGRWICVLAGIATAIVLGRAISQLTSQSPVRSEALMWALIGAGIGGVYCLVLARSARRHRTEPKLDVIFG